MSKPPSTMIDLTGRRYGKLLVLVRKGDLRDKPAWLCRCECGVERIFRGDLLRDGRRKSCGAKACRLRRPRGVSRLKEYQSWWSMWERCTSRKHKNWKRYGGRGIKICSEWEDFDRFYRDMGPMPARGMTIEREDNDGNYEKSNCRWSTKQEQRRNTSRTIYVEYEGRRMLLIDLVAELGLSRPVVYQRIKSGWTLADALSVPVRPRKPNGHSANVPKSAAMSA